MCVCFFFTIGTCSYEGDDDSDFIKITWLRPDTCCFFGHEADAAPVAVDLPMRARSFSDFPFMVSTPFAWINDPVYH